MGPEATSGSSGEIARLLAPLATGGVALAIVLRIFQGGATEDVVEPSLNLIADALLLAAVVIAALRAALEGEIALPPARLLVPLGGLVAAAWLSLLRAEDLYAGLRRAELFSAAALLALLVFPLAARRESAAGLLAIVLAAGAVTAGLAWKERLFDLAEARAEYRKNPALAEVAPELRADYESRLFTDQVSGPFLLPNGLGAFLAMTALAAGAAALATRGAGRVLATATAALALGGMVFTHEKGCWLALAAGAAVAAGRRKLLVAGAALAAAGLVAVAIVPTERLERLPGGLSIAVRKEYWQTALRMAAERPLTGVGAGNFGEHYARLKPARAEETRFAHDDYLEALAEMGPLGAASLVAFWVIAVAGRKRMGQVPPPGPLPEGGGLTRVGEVAPPCVPSGAPVAMIVGGSLSFLLLPLLNRHTQIIWGLGIGEAPTIFIRLSHLLGIAFVVLAIAFERVLRAASPRILAAGAAGGAAAFALQAGIDFLHVESGLLVAAIALAAIAWSGAPPLVLRPPAPVRALAAAAAFALFVLVATSLLPRLLASDAAKAEASQAMRRGEVARAESALAAAIEAVPADVVARAMLADALAARDAGDAALAAYAAATAGRSGLADVKARAAALLGADPRALAWLDAAVRAYPTHPRYRFLAGRAHAAAYLRDSVHPERAERDEGARDLEAALAADDATRLARVKLAPPEREAARDLLRRLSAGPF